MKTILQTIGCVILSWFLSAILFSIIFAMGGENIVQHRNGIPVVEFTKGTATGSRWDGMLDGKYGNDRYIVYNPDYVEVGETVISAFVYNPATNYTDDFYRFDLFVW